MAQLESPASTGNEHELDAIRTYDEAKASGEEAIPLEQAFEEIERQRR